MHAVTHGGIGLKVLACDGVAIDTPTVDDRLVSRIFAARAEFECALIVERTKTGLAPVTASR
jgi:DNA invertase Pin-like site-specific DNA recombinase